MKIKEHNAPSYSLGRYLDILSDPERQYTVEDIMSGELDAAFKPLRSDSFSPGFNTSAHWLRMQMINQTSKKQKFYLEIASPLIDRVDLYIIRKNGEIHSFQAGMLIPYQQRKILHRKPVFPFYMSPGAKEQLIFRYQDNGSVSFSAALFSPEKYRLHTEREFLYLGLYYGAMLIIVLYNLIIYLIIRIRSYLFYVIYISTFLLWQCVYNGLAAQFFWPSFPWLTNHALGLFISLSGITALYFTKIFFATDSFLPKTNKFINTLICCFFFSGLLALLPDYEHSIKLSAFFAVLFAPTILFLCIYALLKGYRPARYFIIAWFVLLCGTAALGLKSFGMLPNNFFTEYGQQIGSLLEALLLSLALADKFNTMKEEKEAAQARALEVQKNATTLLEKKVAERTRELSDSNKNLQILSTKLSKYLSPQIYQSIFSGQRDVRRTSARKKLTVFFSDIKNFTTITDNMEPESLSYLLNYYLDEMAEIALRHGGTIDKYIGDAIMIFFGDPQTKGEKQDALACLQMAIEMRDFILSFSEKFCSHYNSPLPFMVRIGINTGYCTVGNFGSENRLDYTIIGSHVNLASRLESAAEPNQILISSTTYELIKDEINCVEKGVIPVKGFAYPIKTYEVETLKQKSDHVEINIQGRGYNLSVVPGKMAETEKIKLVQAVNQLLGGNNPTGENLGNFPDTLRL